MLLLLLPLLAPASCTPLQEWLQQPSNTTVMEGTDAVLACRVTNKVGEQEQEQEHLHLRLVDVSGVRTPG